jgi:hypothetical protein
LTRSRSSRASDTLRRRGSPVRQARRATSCIPTKLPARPHTTLHFPRARLEPRCTTLFITLCFKAIRHRYLCPFQHHMSLVPGIQYQTPAGEYGTAHTHGSDRAGLQMLQTRPAQMPPLPRHPTAAQAATSGERSATGARGSTGLRARPPPPTTKMSAQTVAGC